MSKFTVEIYAKADGKEPVNEFLYELPDKMRAKVLQEIRLFSDFGNELREPYSKLLEDGIYELRAKQGSDISRVLYFFVVGRKIILTNGFVKKTQKTPESKIELAKKYRDDYIHRQKGE